MTASGTVSGSTWQLRKFQQECLSGHLHHAYLIAGPRGIGKAEFANRMTTAVLCRQSSADGEPCGVCDSCRRVAHGSHPDVDRYSLEQQQATTSSRGKGTSLTVDTVRQISASSSLKPFSASHRVIVIEDAESMMGEAQEAFLKTLEEPPPYLVLVLLTDTLDVFRPTVLSRCQVIELRPEPFGELVARVIESGSDQAKAANIAALAFGSRAWALAAAEDTGLFESRQTQLEAMQSWIRQPEFGRFAKALELGASFANDRASVSELLTMLSHVWRSILRTSTEIPNDADRLLIGDIGVRSIHPREALRAVQSVTTCQQDLEANVRPRLALAAMVTQWPNPDPSKQI